MTETRLKIAVFIDFDNIEIGVKTTLNQQFDIAAILEALKERGEVVTKVAYGDWKRAGDYGRLLSQHAIRMVQRNLTPGGDKNGADINLALDALEMAFTHDHINAFVIVGGDSDFITLVEKLKQYDKKVFVVGGRQFTSLVMQKNCHEFIAYENLVNGRRAAPAERRSDAAPGGPIDVAKAIPLVKRGLKVLADREVSPQLGLLKSTLLQLDSTFSERDYGASTFRDFIEKIAKTGLLTLRHSGRSLLVDLADNGVADASASTVSVPRRESVTAGGPPPQHEHAESRAGAPPGVEVMPPQQSIQRVRELLRAGQPRWPMYVRQLKQYLRGLDEGFDERRSGFTGIVEFLRACQREGVFRLERDRKGVLRIFPGPSLPRASSLAETLGQAPADEISEQPRADSIADALEREGPEIQAESQPTAPAIEDPGAVDAETIAFRAETPEQDDQPTSASGEEPVRPTRARRPRKAPASGRSPARRSSGARPPTARRKRLQPA